MTMLPLNPAGPGSSASIAGQGPASRSRPASRRACSLATCSGRAASAARARRVHQSLRLRTTLLSFSRMAMELYRGAHRRSAIPGLAGHVGAQPVPFVHSPRPDRQRPVGRSSGVTDPSRVEPGRVAPGRVALARFKPPASADKPSITPACHAAWRGDTDSDVHTDAKQVHFHGRADQRALQRHRVA